MMRGVETYLLATGLLPRAPTVPPDGKQDGLSCAAFDIHNTDGTTDESNLAPTIAPVVTEGETEDTSLSSNTPRDEITPTYGATRNNANPNTCGTTSTDSNEKTKGPGHTGTYVPHSRDRQPAETALSQGEHQCPHRTTVQRITDLLRKSQELVKRQTGNLHVFRKLQDLDNGGTGGEYVTNDDRLLWYAPQVPSYV